MSRLPVRIKEEKLEASRLVPKRPVDSIGVSEESSVFHSTPVKVLRNERDDLKPPLSECKDSAKKKAQKDFDVRSLR